MERKATAFCHSFLQVDNVGPHREFPTAIHHVGTHCISAPLLSAIASRKYAAAQEIRM